MLTYLTLTLVLAAPAPAATTKPVPVAGDNAPPRIVEVKADDKGKLKIQVTRTVKFDGNNQGNANIVVNGNGGAGVIVIGQAVPPGGVANFQIQGNATKVETAELSEVKDLKIQTVAGKEVSTAEAIKKLANGGFVITPADGKKIDPKYLKLFAPDVLILSSPELKTESPFPGMMGGGGFGGLAVPGNAVQILPALPAAPAIAVPPPAPAKD